MPALPCKFWWGGLEQANTCRQVCRSTQLMSSLFNIISIVHRASRSNNLQLVTRSFHRPIWFVLDEKFFLRRKIFFQLDPMTQEWRGIAVLVAIEEGILFIYRSSMTKDSWWMRGMDLLGNRSFLKKLGRLHPQELRRRTWKWFFWVLGDCR